MYLLVYVHVYIHTHKCRDIVHHRRLTDTVFNQEHLHINKPYVSLIKGNMGRLMSGNITQEMSKPLFAWGRSLQVCSWNSKRETAEWRKMLGDAGTGRISQGRRALQLEVKGI